MDVVALAVREGVTDGDGVFDGVMDALADAVLETDADAVCERQR
jgi:hypothetical protein